MGFEVLAGWIEITSVLSHRHIATNEDGPSIPLNPSQWIILQPPSAQLLRVGELFEGFPELAGVVGLLIIIG